MTEYDVIYTCKKCRTVFIGYIACRGIMHRCKLGDPADTMAKLSKYRHVDFGWVYGGSAGKAQRSLAERMLAYIRRVLR